MKTSMEKLVTIFDTPSPTVLRTPTTPVSVDFLRSPAWPKLMSTLQKVMKKAKGIGLAAPQIGLSHRIAIVDKSARPDSRQPLFLINPVISQPSRELLDFEEGCLSVPDVFGYVERPTAITVSMLDLNGNPITFRADGLLARVIQHEVDHLDGVLFIDRCHRYTVGAEKLP